MELFRCNTLQLSLDVNETYALQVDDYVSLYYRMTTEGPWVLVRKHTAYVQNTEEASQCAFFQRNQQTYAIVSCCCANEVFLLHLYNLETGELIDEYDLSDQFLGQTTNKKAVVYVPQQTLVYVISTDDNAVVGALAAELPQSCPWYRDQQWTVVGYTVSLTDNVAVVGLASHGIVCYDSRTRCLYTINPRNGERTYTCNLPDTVTLRDEDSIDLYVSNSETGDIMLHNHTTKTTYCLRYRQLDHSTVSVRCVYVV